MLDPQGRAQSKSLGNVVDPVEIADKLGAEIIRLWVASVDFREDVMSSDELMQRIADSYRKIRNTFRYILGNLEGFDPARDVVPFAEMHPLDQYILLQAAEVTKDVRSHYDSFTFHRLYQRLKDFCIVDLSAIYFDVLKDRLYTSAPKSPARRSAQTALWRLGEALVRLLAPVMSFTADEVWGFLPPMPTRPESVHLEHFPAPEDLTGELPAGFDAAAIKSELADPACRSRRSVESSGGCARREAHRQRPGGAASSGRAGQHLSRARALSRSAAISVHRLRCRAGQSNGE